MSLPMNAPRENENLNAQAIQNKANSAKHANELVDIFLKAGILTSKQVSHARRVSSKVETPKPLTVLF